MWHVLGCGHTQTFRRFKGKGGAQIDEAYLGEVRYVEPTIEEFEAPKDDDFNMDTGYTPQKMYGALENVCMLQKIWAIFFGIYGSISKRTDDVLW